MQEPRLPHRTALFPHAAFDVVSIATSLGGPCALLKVLSAIPEDFPAAITVVQHLSPRFQSRLVELLRGRVRLPVCWAASGQRLRPGNIYIAPPDRHLRVTSGDELELSDAPRVNFTRPAADVLFESVAAHFPGRALAVVLTGMLYDGALGAASIKQQGGMVLAQEPATAQAYGMPRAAISTGCVDVVLPLKSIAQALISLVMVRGAASLFRVPPPFHRKMDPHLKRW